MSDFARKLSYGATKPRPHNAAGAPEDQDRAGDGPALAVVPEAEAGEPDAEVRAEAVQDTAESDESAGAAVEVDGSAEASGSAEVDGSTEDGAAAEDVEPGGEVVETGDEPAAEAAGEAVAPAADVSAPAADADERVDGAAEAEAVAEGEDGADAAATDAADAAAAEVAAVEVAAVEVAAVEVAEPETPRPGETTIADEVVEKVAGIAARKVPGVYDLGGDASRLVSTVRERIGLGEGSSGRGISVKLSGRAAKLAVTLVVEYGHAVYQVADEVRQSVGDAVEKMLGIEVTELNIVVDDVHVPDA